MRRAAIVGNSSRCAAPSRITDFQEGLFYGVTGRRGPGHCPTPLSSSPTPFHLDGLVESSLQSCRPALLRVHGFVTSDGSARSARLPCRPEAEGHG